uniref:Uncharacterized protein n=1 Tax=Candidatus Kentrum sp. DK TaxID=2126562 RepID=A0A450SKS0_9GAMM|nr:MAG: hypothetical protein BECKDK2373B_GA0170837_104527 [Candidatus Kentron sp. DK]
MPLRGKRAASESGAPSGGPFLMHHFEIRKLCFSDTSKKNKGRQTSAPTGHNLYSPGQRPGEIKTDIQRALKGRHNLHQPKSCLGLLYSALTGLNRRPIRSRGVAPRSLSDLGVRREGKRDRDQNLCKFEANSELFNENLRGFWPISAFPQQNHPKSDRLLAVWILPRWGKEKEHECSFRAINPKPNVALMSILRPFSTPLGSAR